MKTVVLNLALLTGCVSAFAPPQSAKASLSLLATTADLEAMIGPDVECGSKIVSNYKTVV